MPAVRPGNEDFENVPGDKSRVKCLVCSSAPLAKKDVILKQESKRHHVKNLRHKQNLEARRRDSLSTAQEPSAHNQVHSDQLGRPAHLTLAARFDFESDFDSSRNLILQDTPQSNPFDSVMDYGDGHFYDVDGSEILFTVDNQQNNNLHEQLNQEMDILSLFEHTLWGKLTDSVPDTCDDATVADAVRRMAEMGFNDNDDRDNEEDIEVGGTHDLEYNAQWAPHGSKTMFFLDMLDNMPRLRLSDDHLKAIIWTMRECGTPNVPSFSALRKMQAEMSREIAIKPRHHTSSLGNEFYVNHPIDLLKLDWSNPFVREHICPYVEIVPNISETWQAEKYLLSDNDELSPMWADWDNTPYKHFYTQELAQLDNGEYVIPVRWVIFEKLEHAEVYRIIRDSAGHFRIFDPEIVRIRATQLKYNYIDLLGYEGGQLEILDSPVIQASIIFKMPNPIRTIAAGRPAFVIRVMPWVDDVSGNRSKQYNAHVNMYLANVNLPHRKLSQEYFIRFCCTSQHASSSELFDAVAEDLSSDTWHEAYDCALNQNIVFRIRAHVLPADNPQQAESTSTAGSQSNLWCREDKSGGTALHRESDEGYHALFEPGQPRTPEETISVIKKQIWTACLGVQETVKNIQTETGVKDKTAEHWIQLLVNKARKIQQDRVYNKATRDSRFNDRKIKGTERQALVNDVKAEIQKELYDWVITQPSDRYDSISSDADSRRELRPGDHYNVLLRLRGLDPHRDSPCEILHTVLLGSDKYLWYQTNKDWDKKKDGLFATRLQSSSIDGLNMSPLRAQYILQYKNSLVGRHFKALQQLAVFHFHGDLCSPQVLDLWKANGELGALIWFPEIGNMDQYLSDLEVAVANVLDLWAIVDPSRIIEKYKLHVLGHTAMHVKRFGPAVLFSTEVFECWNAIFRLCSVLSNHQAPSYDIASTLADMERFKHQVSGGWWKNQSGKYVQAGEKVREFLLKNSELQRRLGYISTTALQSGTVKRLPSTKQTPGPWRTVLGELWSPEMDARGAGRSWIQCKYVVSQSHDVCKAGSWVFFQLSVQESDGNRRPGAGRISKILADADSDDAVVVIDSYDVSETNDTRLNMPVLTRNDRAAVVVPKAILFIFNAQHDCYTGQCAITEVPVKQGRNLTARKQASIVHSKDERYFLNMHALHNAHLIREVLPRELSRPKPYLEDRRAKHNEIAAKLRTAQAAKRQSTKEKAKATRARNKRAKQAEDDATAAVRRVDESGASVVDPEPETSDSDGDGELCGPVE